MLDIVSEYSVKRKVKAPKSKNLDDTNSQGVDLTSRENFIFNTHYIICNKLIFELKKRNNAYLEIEKKFSFLFKSNMKKSDIIEYTANLLDLFPNDLDKEMFVDEMLQFQELKMSVFNDQAMDDPHYQLKYLKSMNIKHTFPNIETVLQIYLTMPCTNCSSERSFSALKRVNTRLRSCLSQDRLDNLILLTVEHEITKKLSYDDIIDEFSKDPRKKTM